MSTHFKDVLEVRTRNLQASRSRTENFVSSVSQHTQPSLQQSASPLYGTPSRGTPSPGADLLSLNPTGDQQLLQMEEAQPQNIYRQRGEAIEAIERTIGELGGIFSQLATMVSEQSEMIQRIDANTEDVVDNVEGAQRELLKYFARVSSNRQVVPRLLFSVAFHISRPPQPALRCVGISILTILQVAAIQDVWRFAHLLSVSREFALPVSGRQLTLARLWVLIAG